MSELVQVKLPDGETIWARVGGGSGPQDVGLREAAEAVTVDLDKTIRAVAASVRGALDSIQPDEVAVQFGVELVAKTGKVISVLAEAGGKATLTLTLTWNPGDRKSQA